MKKPIKSLNTKTIVVRLTTDNVSEYNVDSDIFDDVFLEAATRAVEKLKSNKYGKINSVANCWEKKKPKEVKLYNSYWILINAGCYAKAEELREKFKFQHKVDLSKEPVHD